MKAPIYNQEGKKAGDIELPERVFGARWNGDLVHQVVTSQQANRRTPVAHTKDRGDVSGGGKKPWRQKGTGRARHGSTRSPIWRTGGVTFGPRNEKVLSKKINRKMKTNALFSVLSKKFADGEVLFVDSLAFGEPKTAKAREILHALADVKGFEALAGKKKNAALIAVAQPDGALQKSWQNFGNVATEEVRNLNPTDALTYKYLIITSPEASVGLLEQRLSTQSRQAAGDSVKEKAVK